MLAIATSLLCSVTAQRPNIVYIMADDLGYGEVSCFGQTKIPTPNIDRLAREGIKMTRAYAASTVCAPTRYSLMTGRHQGHSAIRGNSEQGGFGPNDKEGQMPIAQSETLISEVLSRAGYRTGLIGKWGLGGTEPGQSPLDHGFDEFYGYLCQRRAHNHYPVYLWNGRDPDILGNSLFSAHQKLDAPLQNDEAYSHRYGGSAYAPEKLASACERFLESPDKRPFFLYYAPTLPHVALQAPQAWVNKFPKAWDKEPYLGQAGYLPCARPRATYAAMVAFLDDTVGRILKLLDEKGVANETLVIFTSDNGPANVGGVDPVFFNSAGGLRGGKMSLYEGGIREPFVARWPGHITAGSQSKTPIASYDAFATLAEVAGKKANPQDGISYLGLLVSQPCKHHDYLYFEYPEATPMQAVIMGSWKLVRPNLNKSIEKVELYDLENDSAEAKDVSQHHPDIVLKGLRILNTQHRTDKNFPLGVLDRIVQRKN